jgi:hypothetical protein
MNSPLELSVPEKLFPLRQKFGAGAAHYRNLKRFQKMFCCLLAMAWPFAAAFAQSSSSSQQPASQQPAAQSPPPAQAKPAAPDQPPPKEDSLAEAARKAKEKKPATAKPKVYTADDLSGMKGTGVSVVGETPKTGARRPRTTYPDGNGGENSEEYWRGMARQILDAIAETDQEIAQKKEEIKKFGNGGFDVTTGMKDNIAYINDRTGQLKSLENRKTNLEKQLDDLQEEGRKAGAAPSWFR